MPIFKLTLHLLFYLGKHVENGMLPANYNQVCVETYIGFIKNNLKARSNATESIGGPAKFLESVKVLEGLFRNL